MQGETKHRLAGFSKRVAWAVVGSLAAAAPSGPAYASSHEDAPIITFDANASQSDVYVFKNPAGQDKIYIAAQTSDNSTTPTTNQIVYRFGDLDDDAFNFELLLRAAEDAEAGRNAVFPKIAANANGKTFITWLNDTDFSAPTPQSPPPPASSSSTTMET